MDKKQYQEYLKSNKWKELKRVRLLIDDYKCTKCGSFEKLQIHHKTYKRVGNEDINDITTLCDNCHKEEHGVFNNQQEEYKRYLRLKRQYDLDTKGWSNIEDTRLKDNDWLNRVTYKDFNSETETTELIRTIDYVLVEYEDRKLRILELANKLIDYGFSGFTLHDRKGCILVSENIYEDFINFLVMNIIQLMVTTFILILE